MVEHVLQVTSDYEKRLAGVSTSQSFHSDIGLDVRLVFLVTSFPPNRYVQITRTLLTNLRLDFRLVFFSDLLPP